MTVIKGYNSILLTEKCWKINANQKKYFIRIEKNINRLINVVNDMLDLWRLESWKTSFDFQEFDIWKLLKNDISDYFEDLCKAKKIDFQVKAFNLKVISDSEKIKQVLINLIWNAYKFTSEWGKIEIVLEIIWQKSFKISVIDNWVWIPKQNIAQIFKKFYQINNQLQKTEEWTWLWLPISKTIVEGLWWHMNVDPNPKETGSIFSITLNINWRENKSTKICPSPQEN